MTTFEKIQFDQKYFNLFQFFIPTIETTPTMVELVVDMPIVK